jgi:hypothetical protein
MYNNYRNRNNSNVHPVLYNIIQQPYQICTHRTRWCILKKLLRKKRDKKNMRNNNTYLVVTR